MTNDPTSEKESRRLRTRAESQVVIKQSDRTDMDEIDVKKLVHELEVHQVELQMQNEQLQVTQAELRESRDRYFELYDLAPVGYVTLDRAGNIYEANLAAAALVGEERGRLVGRSLCSFLDQAEADALYLHLGEVFGADTKVACELTFRSGRQGESGTPVRVESICFTLPNRERRCRSVLIDLTELRAVQDAFRIEEVKDQALLDTSGDAILTGDAKGRILSVNRAAGRLFGYEPSELLGKSIRMLMPLEYQDAPEPRIERFLSTGDTEGVGNGQAEVVGLRKEGTIFPALLSVGQWSDNGEPRFTAVLHDNTKKKAVEAALAEEETRFREITEVIEDVFYIMDAEHHFLYLSPACERLWGEPEASLILSRAQWLDHVHPEDRSRVETSHVASVHEGAFEAEYRIVRADGEVRWVRDRVFPVLGPKGEIERYIGCAQDITLAKKLEHDLLQVQRVEAVGAFASSVAHDFGNVLQAVLGCVNLARREGLSRKRMLEYLDRASSAARRGGKFAEQLLTFARKRNTDAAPLELDRSIKGCARLIEGLMTEKVAVKIQTAARGMQILADPVQIEQILLNLASNARDAMPDGGQFVIRTHVVGADGLSLSDSGEEPGGGDYICLEVRDTGVGMNEATRRQIFDPFFTTKEVGKGTGLGLSTVLSTANKLGARVDVKSEPGDGSTFTFLFPIHGALRESDERRIHKELRFSGTALLVEDEPTVRMTLRHKLEELGFAVREAADPIEAEYICGLHRGEVELLLSDVVLPVMSGPKLAERLQASYPKLQVLLMSASYEAPHSEDGAGAFQVLRKPFSKVELSAALERLLPSERVERVSLPPSAPAVSKLALPAPPRGAVQRSAVVMVVDDEALVLETLRDFLEGEGHRVLVASTPREALHLADLEECIDVVISDLQIPQMSGHDLTAKLRARHPNLRAIITSALPDEPFEDAVFMAKPLDLDRIAETVEQLLIPLS